MGAEGRGFGDAVEGARFARLAYGGVFAFVGGDGSWGCGMGVGRLVYGAFNRE